MARLLDSLAPWPPPVTYPKKDGMLWDIPASYFYPHRDAWAKIIPLRVSAQKARLGLDRAVGHRSMFHLWFHPFNLASDPDTLLNGLQTIFSRVNTLRSEGALANLTMADLAASLRPTG